MTKKIVLLSINLIVFLLIVLLTTFSIKTRNVNMRLQEIITYYPRSMQIYLDSSNIEISKCRERINALNKELISEERLVKNHKETE